MYSDSGASGYSTMAIAPVPKTLAQAMAMYSTRKPTHDECIVLGKLIIAELQNINRLIDAAVQRAEVAQAAAK